MHKIIIVVIRITIIIMIIIIIIIIIIKKSLSKPLQWLTCACLNWLVRMGRHTVWRDKSPKATVTSFIVQIQVVGLPYWLP